MAWTWDEISEGWLGGCEIAPSPETLVAAFDRAEALLGRGWIESGRLFNGFPVSGAAPTLRVAWMGQRLVSLNRAERTEELLERLRQNDQAAESELTAIHLLCAGRVGVDLELYPPTSIGSHTRHPDFRIGRDSVWTYVEVTQTGLSEARERAQNVLQRIAQIIGSIKKSFSLDVFLRREPSNDELVRLGDRLIAISSLDGVRREDIPGLAILSLNHSQPSVVAPPDHPGESSGALCVAGVIGGNVEPHRHISVRLVFEDVRAEQIFTREAKQLPNDAPGLIMIDAVGAPGAFESWPPLLLRRFQPTIHTRVGAVCLFMTTQLLTDGGFACFTETKLLVNPHAALPIPPWVLDALTQSGDDYRKAMARATAAEQ